MNSTINGSIIYDSNSEKVAILSTQRHSILWKLDLFILDIVLNNYHTTQTKVIENNKELHCNTCNNNSITIRITLLNNSQMRKVDVVTYCACNTCGLHNRKKRTLPHLFFTEDVRMQKLFTFIKVGIIHNLFSVFSPNEERGLPK